MKIFIDNDACPRKVRDIVFKAGDRLSIPIVIVANSYMHPPPGFDIRMITVNGDFDAADDRIVTEAEAGDLVITADIPLADRVVSKGAHALNPRGESYTPENIKEKLGMRDLAQELRSAGDLRGGPKPLGPKEIQAFASSFDRLLAKHKARA